MRTITTSTTVYTLNELDAPTQEKAIANLAEKFGGEWWGQSDNDDIRDTMTWALAEQLGTPGHLDYGVSDYPGIPNIKIDGWDLDRGQSLLVSGAFTRENAPKLPWVDGLDAIEVTATRDHNTYTCVSDTLGANVVQTIRDCVSAAWKAGYAEMEYKSSEERAREWIDGNEPEFTADGDLYR